ncbi:MAG TPA: hypothetical protein VNT81_20320 [Vicinamibacterales bacterium]|nr:hypothetical protein [Vicinamibacterales bacterium]
MTLRETNGVGLTVTNLTAQLTLADTCPPSGTCPSGSPDFAVGFRGCGHSGYRIEAKGVACSTGLYGASLFGLGGGFLDWSVTGTDDRGNTVSASVRITLLPP